MHRPPKLTVDTVKNITYVETAFTVLSPRYIAGVVEREFGHRPAVEVDRGDTTVHVTLFFNECYYDDDPMHHDTVFNRRLHEYVEKLYKSHITDEDLGYDTRLWKVTYEIPI